MQEINFDGLVGPTHNFAGLSLGNVASASSAGNLSHPRTAALQGLSKMQGLIALGIPQGMLIPHERPNIQWLRQLGFHGDDAQVCAAAWTENPGLLRNAISASAMWTANAATISPAPDTADGRCHLSVANLSSMLHRSTESVETERQLRLIFADERHFAVHGPLPNLFGDEGAANFMRMCSRHDASGIEIFVYGEGYGQRFPARQCKTASEAIIRRHRLDRSKTFLVQQSDVAIQAGAFHNDVVAVANETVLLTHEQAFEEKERLYEFIYSHLPEASIIEVPADLVSLDAAIRSYLFNSQIVTLPDRGMALIVPAECQEDAAIWSWLQSLLDENSPIQQVRIIDVRESMRNGGGPACLRLRIVVDDITMKAINPLFLLDERKCDILARIIDDNWPRSIAPADLGNSDLWAQCANARTALMLHLSSTLKW